MRRNAARVLTTGIFHASGYILDILQICALVFFDIANGGKSTPANMMCVLTASPS